MKKILIAGRSSLKIKSKIKNKNSIKRTVYSNILKSSLLLLFCFGFSNCTNKLILLPEGQEISKKSAIRDIHYNSKIYWLHLGGLNDYRCKSYVRKEFGIEIYEIKTTSVNKDLENQIEEYNNTVDEYISEAFDENWKKKLFDNNSGCTEIELEGF